MFVFFITAFSAFLLTPIVIKFYKKNQWFDDPKKSYHAKKTHFKPVPRGGGLVIFFSILVSALFFLQFDKYLMGIMSGALILVIVGFLDDIYDIHPQWRLIAGIMAGLLVVGSGIGIAYISNPFGAGVIHLNQPQIAFKLLGTTHTIWVLSDLFALIFILWNMNIVNWSKGIDGQMPGFVSIALIFIGILSYKFIDDPTQFNTAYLSFIAAGAFAGFLIWNFYPQKIMPGYGAGSLAGYFLAVLAILSGAKLAATFMVLAIPTADAIFTISRRILAGKSPLWGDRGHLHHKLLDIYGWGRRRIALFYWLATLGMGFLALYLNTLYKMITMILVIILVFAFLVWTKLKNQSPI